MMNTIERALWTGVQTFVGILAADGFGWLQAETWAIMATAGMAAVVSALKTLSQDRLQALETG